MSHIIEELRKHFRCMSPDQYLELREKLDNAYIKEHPKLRGGLLFLENVKGDK